MNTEEYNIFTENIIDFDFDKIKELVMSGKNINSENSHGYTPLMFSILNKIEIDNIIKLINLGADVNYISQKNKSVINIIIQNIFIKKSDYNLKVLDLLISNNLNWHIESCDGYNFLTYLYNKDKELYEYITEKYSKEYNKYNAINKY
ncbi:hypothetical protein M0Q97_02355 [Candidatus Dojkabacteria bacterium]|jgi:hypothetical protein|nr:hypothetical protein [Candidatus Dojkabacteria bacterium]